MLSKDVKTLKNFPINLKCLLCCSACRKRYKIDDQKTPGTDKPGVKGERGVVYHILCGIHGLWEI